MTNEKVHPAIGRQLTGLPGPRGLPLLGNLLELSPKRLHLQLEQWARRHGDIYLVHLGPKPLVVVSDAALINQILRERPRGFRRLGALREVVEELNATGVFTAEGDDWTRQRRLVMSAFGASHLRAGHAAIAEITRRLGRTWQRAAERGESVDAVRDLMRYTVDVTSVVGFGTDLNTVEHGTHELRSHLDAILRAVSRRMNAPFPLWRYIKLPADRALDRSSAEVERVILSLIAKARRELESDPVRAANPRNLLEAMLAARDGEDPSARLSDREVFGNVLTVLVAGEDSAANTLAWMLYFMARHPELQTRMQAEVDAELGAALVPASPEAVHHLRYINAMAHETLRLKPAVPVMFFEPIADTVLGDVLIPAGTGMLLLTRLLALQDSHFHQATVFDPTRWLGPTPAGHPHEPRAALAFGGGPRVCPGRALALLECSMIGAMVARSFDVAEFAPGTPVSERLDLTMKPVGLRVRFTPRQAAPGVWSTPSGTL